MPNGTIGNLRLLFKDTVTKRTFDNIQKVSFSNVPTVGSFKLKYGSSLTANIDWNDVVADVKSALEALTEINEVTVTGNFTTGFIIRFSGPDSNKDKLTFEYDSNTLKALTVDTVITIEVQSRGYNNLGEHVESSPIDTQIKGLKVPIPEGKRIEISQYYDIKSVDSTFYTKEVLSDDDLIIESGYVYRIKTLRSWYGYSEAILYERVLL